jgi:hypothetical protein
MGITNKLRLTCRLTNRHYLGQQFTTRTKDTNWWRRFSNRWLRWSRSRSHLLNVEKTNLRGSLYRRRARDGATAPSFRSPSWPRMQAVVDTARCRAWPGADGSALPQAASWSGLGPGQRELERGYKSYGLVTGVHDSIRR